MVNVKSNFTSHLKEVIASGYTRYQVLLQLFVDDFGISEEESNEEQAECTYTYFGSQIVYPVAIAAHRSSGHCILHLYIVYVRLLT